MRRVMFDVDGTLVDSDAFDGDCFCAAVREITGSDPDTDWTRYRHVTDAGILDQHLREHGLEADAAAIGAEVKRAFTRRIAARLERYPARPIAGAIDFVARLRGDTGTMLSIATGGWRDSALLKLRSAGFAIDGLPLASSDDHYARDEIMRIAARAAGDDAGRWTYFGDGEWDRQACARLGFDFVLVGSRTRHPRAIADFSDPAPALAYLGMSPAAAR